MSTEERAKAMIAGANGNGNGSTQTVSQALAKSKQPGTMLGLKTTDVASVIEAYRGVIAQALPKHLTPERIIQTATTLITRTPAIAECSAESIIGAVVQCSILGFEPIPALGQAYLVPFYNSKTGKKEIQFIIGYRGLIDLVRRSDKIKTITSQAVFKNDMFEYEFGLDPVIKHKPALGDRGELIYVYAVASFTNGGFMFEVMSKDDVEKIRKRSKAGDSKFSPWSNPDDYQEMAKKTVLRRLCKYLPMSVEYRDLNSGMATDGAVIGKDALKQGGIDINAVEQVDYVTVGDETVNTSTGEVTAPAPKPEQPEPEIYQAAAEDELPFEKASPKKTRGN